MKYSTNEQAEQIVGKREPVNGIIFDFPCELGYQCPICKNDWDEGLQFSEYNGFIWCATCNRDYPSALCQPDIEQAIKIYLTCVKEAKNVELVKKKIKVLPNTKIITPKLGDVLYRFQPKSYKGTTLEFVTEVDALNGGNYISSWRPGEELLIPSVKGVTE